MMPENNKANTNRREIELRSEKVRNIVGKVPPLLLRVGIAIISVIVVSLLVAAYLLPYREYKRVDVELFCRPGYQNIVMPQDGNVFMTTSTTQVKQGQQVCYIQTNMDSIVRFHALFNGKVLFDASYGDFCRKGKLIYTIVPDSIKSIYGIAYLREEEMLRIAAGQPVDFSPTQASPYIPDQLVGRVSAIYLVPSVRESQKEAMYKVEIEFPEYKPTVKNPFFPSFSSDIKGSGQILISDKPLLKRILGLN